MLKKTQSLIEAHPPRRTKNRSTRASIREFIIILTKIILNRSLILKCIHVKLRVPRSGSLPYPSIKIKKTCLKSRFT
uniref:Candidate secreted effector n=1 Tax=Meloidogyne incognita TaxID=6306 RepID=A0A914L3A4_MELIC